MKKEKPILFNTTMVQAILDGRKSQTRRIIKQAIGWGKEYSVVPIKEEHIDGIQRYEMRSGTKYGLHYFKSKYQPGDIMWVREATQVWITDEQGVAYRQVTEYIADNPEHVYMHDGDGFQVFNKDGTERFIKITPSIFMPKEAARIWLECTGVRVERVQDISEEDAIKEGVEQNRDGSWHDYLEPNRLYQDCARASFISLWISINGQESWDSNPWVFVYDFKVLSTTGKPL